ncbi:MAG TPA: CRTAC1 family protein, partial [Methylomirabilota bacterium]|nr:CRTAC1 family protein [Methylomirabilota bacterium]
RNRLFHQRPDGTFEDVSAGSGVDVAGFGMGAIAGDVNNDRLTDLVLTEYGATRLFLNRGRGKFAEVTSACGLDNPRWATAASFLDFDRDGWLDLVVGNYVDYPPTHQCRDARGQLEYCGPHHFAGTVTRLFRNLGGAPPARGVAFADVTVPAGLATAPGPALGVFCADFDGDRWPDIFLADDGRPNRLFLNQRDGTFIEEAMARGVAFNSMGASAANMGVAVGDVTGDGLFDLFLTHLDREQHALWVQGPRGFFQDQTARHGLVNPARRGTGFGAVLADLDHDGWADLAWLNGRIERGAEEAPRVEGLDAFWAPYAQRAQLFLNQGQGRFVDATEANPDFCGRAAVGRALVRADFDNDGDLDLLATSTGGPVQLFRNVSPKRGHWLMVRALDPARGGRDAIGAEVRVRAGGRTFAEWVQPSASYLASHDPRVHFGLGEAPAVEAIEVLWPDGLLERFPGGAVDRHLTLRRGEGKRE